MSSKRALCLNAQDNVAVALEYIKAGDEVAVEVKGGGSKSIRAIEEIPFGFKLALTNMKRGDHVLKYGEVMGQASEDIQRGAQVHVHNVGGVRVQAEGEKGDGS